MGFRALGFPGNEEGANKQIQAQVSALTGPKKKKEPW